MLRILTYNVHRWLGTDRKIAPERTADVIASCEPDIVALQEVRAGRLSKGQADQAVMVANRLGMDLHFQPTIRVLGEQYGIAILTRHPSRLVRSDRLPSISPGPAFEKRSALWVTVEVGGQTLNVVNAHLSLRSRERLAQATALCGEEWISHRECLDPAILLGDFNAPPRSRSYRLMASQLLDAQLWNPSGEPQPTFHTRAPILRLDHIFVSRSIDVLSAAPVRTKLSKVASDHFPLMARFQIARGEPDAHEAPPEAATAK
ncbi:endonuclease/exonuclease/phosphatase family protein [Microvirga pudoricolor]|uniref:endonuclease/exonuclease/phosphatase family protein n=1 Tax=Microvirga pudoricolor TaxID=2778729 RepID=UPI001951C97A|nr:endonuclease/exonuclease/phosphatase family protein [Microvirga pudoricolor]MBM6594448.1 endonuclease/exonuclease/phosphatase family protein [Microvirga pudoricolor]